MSAANRELEPLFRRRMLIVAGKGGVGKTTVASALAVVAVRRGKRVLLCEVDGVSRASRLFGIEPGPVGEAVEARPGISLMAVEGKAALAEYLGLIVPVRPLLRAVLKSRIYRYFVAAAPGLKELMTIGKLWYEADRTDAVSDRRRYDLVIVDAPATGHGLQYLRMPAAAREAFGAGLVNREARRLVGLLTDPAVTAVNLVTTAEELPVNETIGMFRAVTGELGMTAGMLFVNRFHQSEIPGGDLRRLTEAAAHHQGGKEKDLLRAVAARAREEVGWAEVNAHHLEHLSQALDVPRVELPFLFAETFGIAEIEQLADRVEGSCSGARGAKG